MSEEQKDPLDVEEEAPVEEAAQQEPTPAEVEEGTSTKQPAEGRKDGWPVVVAVIAAILGLCAVVVCIAAAISIFSGGKDETAAPTAAPVPTRAPGQAMIAITEPDQGQIVDITRPVRVQGKGVGLPEGNVVVEALDAQSNVLAQVPTTLQGPDVGTGGEGTWSTELTIEVEPGTAGRIRAFSTSPADGSILAEDVVEVSLGETLLPTIHSFEVSPDQILTDECVGISWNVSAEATLVQIRRNGEVIIDKGLPAGQQTDCLDTAGSYTYHLEAYNAAGESVFQERQVRVVEPEQPEPPENPLVGTRWQVTAIYDAEVGGIGVVLPGTSLTVAFDTDGKVNGSSGCNTYSASYLVDGSLLAITPPTSTFKICDTPEGIMEQETAFLSALASAGSFTLEGNQLQIQNASGNPVLDLVSQ